MFKKSFLVLSAFLFLIFVVCFVSAANIGYIVKTPYPINADETTIINILEENGHTVSLLDDILFNPNLYDIIIVGEDVTSTSGIFDNKNHKTIFLSQEAAKNAGLAKYQGVTTNSKITISSNNYLITEGFLLGDLTVYNNIDNIGYLTGCKALNSQSLAYRSDTANSAILLLEKNALLLNDGNCLKKNVSISERNLFFGLSKASLWNDDANTLFLNSIEWILYGEDKDEDGYHYDDDCNDNNNQTWQNLPGYADNDGDGYGSGSLLDVCSGENLLEGYSEIDGDCNDSNKYKWQLLEGYLDSDKDGYGAGGLLQVCSGYSLPAGYSDIGGDCNDADNNKWQLFEGYVDNDEDGYGTGSLLDVCSGDELIAGYSDIDGDCDDSAASCNLDCDLLKYLDSDTDGYGNPLLSQRACDAPENYVNDNIDCNDSNNEINPDAEEMQYDMTDSNCDNAIEWISEINNIEWNEDETKSFDLSSYIWNPGSSELIYYIYDTSEDKYISVDIMENGIFNFSSDKDWHENDWVIFGVHDEAKDIDLISNNVTLVVNSVNDAPRFIGNIGDINFDEDTNKTDYFDLNDYFYDADEDELTFDVTGNNHINVIIDNGLASFIPDADWWGSEIVSFSASDGTETRNSNEVNITVNDMNESPEFALIDCQLDIDEDTEYTCILNASDFENDSIEFTVGDKNNLNCNINGNELTYSSELNYNGEANCNLIASDANGYDEYLLNVNITPVNDAPKIRSYSPLRTPKLMENTDYEFSINVFDVDGDELDITWFVDGNESGSGKDYIFNNTKGNYEIKAILTDNEFEDEHIWNVFVGDISDFTCQEVDGYITRENQICLGDLLGTSDSNLITCCSIAGQPKFSSVDRCENLSNKLKFEIENPDENDEFIIGDIITGEIRVENDLNEDLDFDVNVYLYDITNDEEIENYEDSISADEGENENLDFEITIPDDLDEKDEYALFVKVIDEDENNCNQDYIPINIEREKYDVIIQKADIDSKATCGGYFNAKIKVKNIGSKDEDVYLLVENPDLNISEKTEKFELEKYDEDDTETKTLSINIPENAEEGNYEIEITAYFGGRDDSVTKTLTVECKQIEENISEIEKISLQTGNTEAKTGNTANKARVIIPILTILLALTAILFILKGGFNNKK
ncbi:MAG: Ig-like domain-containing protein [Candidatus Nanoarchaeia archaeon]|nr:Ig-like domain-containing protein [Candidatus Nanoarchaeia archaeon]MDD5741313.1 Ig-like domain-containing protein [Candidatus Nanoarchaeia archaeon]